MNPIAAATSSRIVAWALLTALLLLACIVVGTQLAAGCALRCVPAIDATSWRVRRI